MTNVTRPAKDVFVSYHSKVDKYKPGFLYSEFKKLVLELHYVINEDTEIHKYINEHI